MLPPCWHQAIFTEQRTSRIHPSPFPTPLPVLAIVDVAEAHHDCGSSVAVLLLVTLGAWAADCQSAPSPRWHHAIFTEHRTSLGPALFASSVARLRTSDIRRAGITTCCVTLVSVRAPLSAPGTASPLSPLLCLCLPCDCRSCGGTSRFSGLLPVQSPCSSPTWCLREWYPFFSHLLT